MHNDRLRESLNNLMGRFGVERADVQDAVIARASHVLAERGHNAEVISLRHGTLLVRCIPVAASLLRYDIEQVRAGIEETHPGMVTEIRLTTRPVRP